MGSESHVNLLHYQTEGGLYSAYGKGMVDGNEVAPVIPGWAACDERLLRHDMFAGAMPGMR